jgi:hypothetical protein
MLVRGIRSLVDEAAERNTHILCQDDTGAGAIIQFDVKLLF